VRTIYSLLKDAAKLPSQVVVVDVFRSSNTIIELLARGAARVVPVMDIREAYMLKKTNPSWILLGERKGKRLPQCEGDNSPTQVLNNVSESTVILTTSGGTRCIHALANKHQVWVGSFANASPLIKKLRSASVNNVGFWAVGVKGEIVATEDELCVSFLNALWNRNPIPFDSIKDELMFCKGAQRLRALEQEDDLIYCCVPNSRSTVPIRELGNDKLWGFVSC